MLTEFERAWIPYARHVLEQNAGCACDADEIAWPGFIGPSYSTGMVLVVGSIHNAPVLRSSGVYDIVPKVREWLSRRQTPESDRAYLDIVWQAHCAAIPRWQWYQNESGKWVSGAVWNGIEAAARGFGLTFSDIAFTNLAKCGLPTRTPWSLEKRRIIAHEADTPLTSIIDALKPRYVLLAKDAAELRTIVRLEERAGLVVRRCHNLSFMSGGRSAISVDSGRRRRLQSRSRTCLRGTPFCAPRTLLV
jgi:hypothetical protein